MPDASTPCTDLGDRFPKSADEMSHLELRREGAEAASAAHALVEQAMLRFAPLRVTPYRWGRLWEPALGAKLDPIYRAFLLDLKRRCDPDGILHPGASIFGAAASS